MNRSVAILLVLPLMAASVFAQTPVRVACLGDSITYGDQLADRAAQSYPAVLERLAEGRFAVGNFGVNGATALPRIPFRSWIDTPACRDALAFAPDVAVLMLGINDLLGYREQLDRYPAALRDLVARFQALPAPPHLFLCTLTPIAPPESAQEVNRIIRDTMNPAIRAVAAETGATVIDVTAAYPNRLDWLPDGLHPSPAGAELIARTVFTALAAPVAAPPQIQPAPVAGPVDLSIRNEAFAARARAEQWMKTRAATADLPEPDGPGDLAGWLPLLAGSPAEADPGLFSSYAALAAALDRAGQETVFLADGRPIAWREALLHQLVQRQRIDSRGGGFWADPNADDPSAVRATAYALRALDIALGE